VCIFLGGKMATLQSQLAEAGKLNVWNQYNAGKISEAQARAQLGGGGASGSGSGTGSPVDLAKQMYQLGQQFAQPAIKTLEAGRAGIAPVYEGLRGAAEAEKEPLTQRYKNLLADITKGTREAAGAEFTRRGIPLSSGVVEQTVRARMAPQIERVGLEREAGLRDINQLIASYGQQELGAQTDLDRAIAAIQGAVGPGAVQSAMGIYGQQEQARRQAAQLALQRWQTEQQRDITGQQLAWEQQQAAWEQPWQERLWEYQLNKPYYKPSDTSGTIPPFPDMG
jgi:hypothetical protein